MSCLTPEAMKAYAETTMETRHREAADLHTLTANLRELMETAAKRIAADMRSPEVFQGPRPDANGRREAQPVGSYDAG